MKSPTPLQSYMRHWKDPLKLTAEYGIKVYEHPTLPLMGFKYDQIDSPKTHPIVRCSRGTVLEKGTWNLVAQPFVRFFNIEECMIEPQEFNWNDFYCNEKLDGSLAIVYFYAGQWHMNTSGSFAKGEMCEGLGKSWSEVFWDAFNGFETLEYDYEGDPDSYILPIYKNRFDKMNPKYTYIFELTSPFNKIVRTYNNTQVTLLGVFNIEHDPYEFNQHYVDQIAKDLCVKRPESLHFTSRKQVEDFLLRKEETDKTYEGVVIVDNFGTRFKVKSKTYLALSRLKDNGGITNPKNIVPIVLSGEVDETLTYFPEIKDILYKFKGEIDTEYKNLKKVWEENYKIEGQKEFALSIKDKTKFSSVLFTLRKEFGKLQTEQDLRNMWRNYADGIIKVLYK